MIVDVDDRSLTTIGQWPWRRDVIGELIARLAHALRGNAYKTFSRRAARVAVIALTWTGAQHSVQMNAVAGARSLVTVQLNELFSPSSRVDESREASSCRIRDDS